MEKFTKQMNKMLYSDWYLALIAFTVYIGWCFELEVVVLIMAIFLGTAMFIFADDLMPGLALLFMVPMSFPSNVDPMEYAFLFPFFGLLVISGAYRIYKSRKKFTLGALFLPQLSVSVVLLTGGLFTIGVTAYLSTLAYAILLGFLLLIMYVFFGQYISQDGKKDLSIHMAKTLMYMGIVISLELFTYTIRNGITMTNWIDLGWGIDNNAATLLLLSAPMCMYLATKYKHGYVYGLIGGVQYLAIIMSFSRGGILFGFFQGVATLALTIKHSVNKKGILIGISAAAVLIIIGYACFFAKINGVISELLSFSASSGTSGRLELYQEAWQAFLSSPILGVGLGYEGSAYGGSVIGFYWFHSTFFQVIASLGIVGLVAFCYRYYIMGKITLTGIKTNTFNQFALMSLLGFEAYSMIDTGTFIPLPQMLIVVLLILVIEKHNKAQKDN
ncbi:MAG: O-antigen ligase family protein [Bacillota bacterium]